MSLIGAAIRTVERAPLPDAVTRFGIDWLVGQNRRRLSALPADETAFARAMTTHPIAEHTDAANEQHYELPPEFFGLVLGPQRKYSSCLFPSGNESLAEAETLALAETAVHAGLGDRQRILELGCGWGSLTLFMARRFPTSVITAVSNSAPQRRYIEAEVLARGLSNVQVVTANMNDFQPDGAFDRIVSVEMFEHMSNWRHLLERVHSWLSPGGRFFMHVFAHANQPYRFDHLDEADWIGQHFFTGGIMPSHRLIRQFPELFEVEQEWRWNGHHYAKTAQAWLQNFDANLPRIDAILSNVYGGQAGLWRRRWRLFFLATAGLFGHGDGTAWAVSHYRLAPSGRD